MLSSTEIIRMISEQTHGSRVSLHGGRDFEAHLSNEDAEVLIEQVLSWYREGYYVRVFLHRNEWEIKRSIKSYPIEYLHHSEIIGFDNDSRITGSYTSVEYDEVVITL